MLVHGVFPFIGKNIWQNCTDKKKFKKEHGMLDAAYQKDFEKCDILIK